MQLAIADAKTRLADLIRRAEAGEEIVLTRHGQAVARLVAIKARPNAKCRSEIIAEVRARAAAKISAGPDAAHAQDFLYDDDGLPQ